VRAGTNTVLVRATQRRGGFGFSLKLCEPESDPRYDGNALAGLEWSVPAPPDARVREQRATAGGGGGEWWAGQSVDLTQSGRAWLSSYLPAPDLTPWVGLDEPLRWGWAMEVGARLEGDGAVHLITDNLRRCHLRTAGPLAGLAGPLTLVVDGARLEPVAVGPGGSVTLSAVTDSTGAVTGWRAAARAGNPEPPGPLATAPARLSRSEAPEGHLDTPLGDWFTDAVRAATGADVAFQNNGGIRTDLEEGPVEVSHFLAMNFPDAVYTFELTGQELLAVLEFDLRDAAERPMQVSGLEYEFDRARPEGQRLVRSSVDPARTYTVASEDYLCERGERFFGRAVAYRETGLHVVDCLVRYAAERGVVTSPGTGRIREVRP
ncbi:MAG: 5'-nucleotidase, partial [Gemmatimonadota bacterium]